MVGLFKNKPKRHASTVYNILLIFMSAFLLGACSPAGISGSSADSFPSDNTYNTDNSLNPISDTSSGDTYETIPDEPSAPLLRISEESIEINGLKDEFHLFYLADSHISLCDERDMELVHKASVRAMMYRTDHIDSWDRFDMLMDEAGKRDSDIVVMGGDIIDSAMYASIDHVREQLDKLDRSYMYYMGNHDFEYGNEYFSSLAYSEYLPRLKDIHGGMPYQVREYDDFIIFAADDHNNQIDQESLDAYKRTAARGKPVILALHVPIEPETGQELFQKRCAGVFGEEVAAKVKLLMGPDSCIPDRVTQEFLDLVLADDSPVILVLAGHVHFYHREMLNERLMQIITGPAYSGEALMITLSPAE